MWSFTLNNPLKKPPAMEDTVLSENSSGRSYHADNQRAYHKLVYLQVLLKYIQIIEFNILYI